MKDILWCSSFSFFLCTAAPFSASVPVCVQCESTCVPLAHAPWQPRHPSCVRSSLSPPFTSHRWTPSYSSLFPRSRSAMCGILHLAVSEDRCCCSCCSSISCVCTRVRVQPRHVWFPEWHLSHVQAVMRGLCALSRGKTTGRQSYLAQSHCHTPVRTNKQVEK